MFRIDLRWTKFLFGAMFIVAMFGATRPTFAQDKQSDDLASRMLKSLGSKKGLCVVLGAEDGTLAVQLSRDGQYLVHGLCTSTEAVDRVRQVIDKAELRGVVSAETGAMARLPYSDNIVNLVVVENATSTLRDGLNVKEILRVLRPGGMAWVGSWTDNNDAAAKQLADQLASAGVKASVETHASGNLWYRFEKPRPKNIDTWTHHRGNASGNPVSADKQIGVPTGVRWVAGPNWPTGDRKASTPTAVASDTHLAVVFEDEIATPTGTRRENSLIVRDVFNGLRLWRRKADSMDVLSAGGRIYTKVDGQLVALDGETGEVEHTFEVADPKEFLLSDGLLVVTGAKGVTAFDIETGKSKWGDSQVPKKMLAGDGQLFAHVDSSRRGGGSELVCFELKTGTQKWAASTKSWAKNASVDLIFYSDGVLVSASSNGNHVVSTKDGSHLWDYKYALIGHGGSYAKVMAAGGLVWIHTANSKGSKQYAWEGLDPQTGDMKKRLLQPKDFTYKHRCSYDVGTESLFLCGSMDFANLETGEYEHFSASRTSCRTAGLVPANGLIYTFPHACGCYTMLRGFLALETSTDVAEDTSERLERGPAFGRIRATLERNAADWPTYRHDVARSGSTKANGPTELTRVWEQTIADRVLDTVALEWDHKDGGRLTSPVVSGGRAFVASSDHHRLTAVDAATGKPQWNFTTGGRIDCPPTIDGNLCLFGSHDGWVYCVTADTGELVWRFRAAPRDRRIVAYGQIESARPVMGGVLVYNGLAFFVVGRHSDSDGGLLVQAVNPMTGELVWAETVTGHEGVPDVLTGGKGTIQMASWEVDAQTGKPKSANEKRLRGGRLGLLNAAWYKRPIAIRRNLSQWETGDRPTGQMLSFNDVATCGYRACGRVNTGNGEMSGNAQLFGKAVSGKEWKVEMPTTARMRGMVLAGDRLYVAGLLYANEKGTGVNNGVRVYNVADGKMLAEHAIQDELVHDCLVVAGGRLYVSTQSGKLICLGSR